MANLHAPIVGGDKYEREQPLAYHHEGVNAQQYQPPVNNQQPLFNGIDLERLQTISTILGPSAGSLAPEPHKRFRDFGNPSPLGLCGFALTTMVLSLVNVHARHTTTPNIVVGLALFYGGLVQLLAGMWEFAVGNTFGATALSSYGGFWLSFAVIFIPFFDIEAAYVTVPGSGKTAPGQGHLGDALGFYLICWAVFTFLLLLCTLKSTVAFFLLFFTLEMAFVLLAVGYFRLGNTGSEKLLKAGGWFGIATASIAWWNALAGIVDKHNSFFAVPVMPLPWSEAGRQGKHRRTTEKDI